VLEKLLLLALVAGPVVVAVFIARTYSRRKYGRGKGG
jgi:hypothetical protein